MILSEEGEELVYRITIEDEEYFVKSPATVFIPKGLRHTANVVSGKGTFVFILSQGKYKAKK